MELNEARQIKLPPADANDPGDSNQQKLESLAAAIEPHSGVRNNITLTGRIEVIYGG